MKLYIRLLGLVLLFLVGCNKPMKTSAPDFDIPPPRFTMQEPKTDTSNFAPLAWEKKDKKKKNWSQMIYSIIENEEPSLLENNPSRDIQEFCPGFNSLSESQRLNFWGHFFVTVAKPESGWNPRTYMVETTFKNLDTVTQRPVTSEGLLQLSYQDEPNYNLDCGFNWDIDQRLDQKDGRRTIFNPFMNLRCGIKIFARQLRKHQAIVLKNGYWQVLRPGDENLQPIKDTAKSFELCRK